MKRKNSTIIQKGWGGLKYIEMRGIPSERDSEFGDLIQATTLQCIEIQIAKAILLHHLPIRGVEVEFLRRVFHLSRRKFASEMGLSDVAVLKWEHAKSKRLAPMSEVAVRVYFAKRLGLRLEEVMAHFIPETKTPKKLVLEFNSNESEVLAA